MTNGHPYKKDKKIKSEFTFGIILTGGGASLKNISDIAQEIFNMPVKIGIPDSVNGKIDIINNPRFSTTVGIVKYAIDNENNINEKINSSSEKNIFSLLKNKIKKIIN